MNYLFVLALLLYASPCYPAAQAAKAGFVALKKQNFDDFFRQYGEVDKKQRAELLNEFFEMPPQVAPIYKQRLATILHDLSREFDDSVIKQLVISPAWEHCLVSLNHGLERGFFARMHDLERQAAKATAAAVMAQQQAQGEKQLAVRQGIVALATQKPHEHPYKFAQLVKPQIGQMTATTFFRALDASSYSPYARILMLLYMKLPGIDDVLRGEGDKLDERQDQLVRQLTSDDVYSSPAVHDVYITKYEERVRQKTAIIFSVLPELLPPLVSVVVSYLLPYDIGVPEHWMDRDEREQAPFVKLNEHCDQHNVPLKISTVANKDRYGKFSTIPIKDPWEDAVLVDESSDLPNDD
jgi:hypothetical protein